MSKPAILGGTFDPLHDGHKALFSKAFELADVVIIGLTSDEFASSNRARKVTDYARRKLQLALYLKKAYPGSEFEIHEMNEIYNLPMTKEIAEGYLVVSEGTKKVGERINKRRGKNGVEPLEIISVPYVLAADGMPIKATRVASGEIDREGNFVKPPRVAVGSSNRIKIESVHEAFKCVFGDARVKGLSVDSGVGKQPMGYDTIKGAKNRAKNAASAWPEKKPPHFAVGLEAGLFYVPTIKKHMDVQYCAVLDMNGRFTFGHSPGFYYPSSFNERITEGHEIEDIMDEFFNIKNIGEKNGAIGFLTNNIVTRRDLLVSSVLMALVPRLKRELYMTGHFEK